MAPRLTTQTRSPALYDMSIRLRVQSQSPVQTEEITSAIERLFRCETARDLFEKARIQGAVPAIDVRWLTEADLLNERRRAQRANEAEWAKGKALAIGAGR